MLDLEWMQDYADTSSILLNWLYFFHRKSKLAKLVVDMVFLTAILYLISFNKEEKQFFYNYDSL